MWHSFCYEFLVVKERVCLSRDVPAGVSRRLMGTGLLKRLGELGNCYEPRNAFFNTIAIPNMLVC